MRLLRVMVLVAALAAAAGLGYWAGREALEPPADPLAAGDAASPTYEVQEGTVGRTLTLRSTARWELVPLGRHTGSGVVTSVDVTPGQEVAAGDVLYTVDLRPVVIAEGTVPMFRTLGSRATGPDVAQLQAMLAELGLYEGDTDGTYGASTRAAVRAWQDGLGVDDTGVVGAGDVVFVPSLPARVVLDPAVAPGGRLPDGQTVVSVVPAAPDFRILLTPDQAGLVPLTASVEVAYAEGVWEGRVDRAVETDSGELALVLTGPDGGPLCGDECAAWVDLTAETSFTVGVVVVPEVTGPVVPVGAISTDAANAPAVTLTDGTLVPVTVVVSANGLAVVDGIVPGTEIRLLVADQ